MGFLEKVRHYYRVAAILLLNTCILLVALNLVLFVVFKIRDIYFPDFYRISKWGTEHLDKIYPDLSREEINDLLRETWSRPYVYEPFTQFKERPYKGKYLNVSEDGFRITKNQGPWPPAKENFNVFLFGGSTTFNYGVPDRQTIASHLQDLLSRAGGTKEARVYNFGRAHYYSTQERLLFEKLIASGFVPDMVVFIDGLNDFYRYKDELAFAYELEDLFEMQNRNALYVVNRLPMARAVVATKARLSRLFGGIGAERNRWEAPDNIEAIIRSVIDRYLRNQKMINAVAFGFKVKAIFVWQPVPTYKYDLNDHLFSDWGFGGHTISQLGYPVMAKFVAEIPPGNNFLWCADIQQEIQEPLYVDRVHYTSKMSRMIASCIVDRLVERKILPSSH